ncbi:hypothetical protein [Photobacterium leiognathi]|uniref:hypothetical protein n=1 Tax=Photobacterium leiognathi TaxID=553611 RepID=UPI0029813B67|nr:hypothetical protein [Photobacterium leiognathi]
MSVEPVKKINMNFVFLNQICLLASYGQNDFSHLGFDEHKVQRLLSMSPQELELFAGALGETFLRIDITPLDRVFSGVTSLPDICRFFLEFGASNRAMKDLLNISFSTSTRWRRHVAVNPKFKQRTLPADSYQQVWDLLMALPNPYKPQPEELIRIADVCQVSIGAIWCDILEEVNNHGKK